MTKNILAVALLLAIINNGLQAQTTKPQQPLKTGNEWKMPSDVFQRAKAFAAGLQKRLSLDSVQTKKVYDAFLINTKPLDEIGVSPAGEKEKQAMRNANKAAFDLKLKTIFSTLQYNKYLRNH